MSMVRDDNLVVTERGDGSRRVAIVCGGGRTKQDMKDECDINKIMARFQRTGAITHVAKYEPQYGFAPAIEFQEATEIVRQAQQMFDDLPSALRKKFENDPAKFLDFVQDEKNADEMLELGLRERPKPERLPATAEEIAAAIAAASAPPEGAGG